MSSLNVHLLWAGSQGMYVLVSRAAGQTEARQTFGAQYPRGGENGGPQAGRDSASIQAAETFKPLSGCPLGLGVGRGDVAQRRMKVVSD